MIEFQANDKQEESFPIVEEKHQSSVNWTREEMHTLTSMFQKMVQNEIVTNNTKVEQKTSKCKKKSKVPKIKEE